MKFDKINNKGQAQLFNNSYLEMLTKTHPLVIWGLYLPIAVGLSILFVCFTQHRLLENIACYFFAGMLFWTFFEYMMHRFIFHHVAESERAKKIIYIMHGNHHHYPRDKERLFMPPVPSLILASVIFAFQYLLMGKSAFHVLPWISYRLPDVWNHALRHTCMEPSFQMGETFMEKPSPASL